MFNTFLDSGLAGGENAVLSRRPYIADKGRYAGHPVIAVNTGQLDDEGFPVYAERPIQTNATLRKDEWINLEDAILEAARERLVIVDDLRSAGLTYNVGGLGTLVSEWETASEITDAEITMDGDTQTNKDRQEFGLTGVPIPIVMKDFSIPERMLMASRQRGASLDVTTGSEAGRSVARRSEKMVFYGAGIGATNSSGTLYTIPGIFTFANRETYTISDWANGATTPETILSDILGMIAKMETEQRCYGPFNLYIPNTFSSRFREDFKANSDKTLMQRVLDEPMISAVRVADVIEGGNVALIAMNNRYLDLAVASDLTTVQWQSGSGFTNHFKNYAAWAPRLKTDFDGRTGILHGSTA